VRAEQRKLTQIDTVVAARSGCRAHYERVHVEGIRPPGRTVMVARQMLENTVGRLALGAVLRKAKGQQKSRSGPGVARSGLEAAEPGM